MDTTAAAGWTCARCGLFVPDGMTHICPVSVSWGNNPAPQPSPTDEKLDQIIFLLERLSRELETIRMRMRG